MKRITIIGGGAGGTLLAVNLLKNCGQTPLSVSLVEKTGGVGRGVAFGTSEDYHLLNVPAAKMSAYPDDPDHFHNWLAANGYDFDPHDFVPRSLFGEYIRSQLDEAVRNIPEDGCEFEIIEDEAVNVLPENGSANVVLRSGRVIPSDKVVLAFGNFLPPHPSVPDMGFTTSPKYLQNAWDNDAYRRIAPDDDVLIIGTGLSMADVALRFHKKDGFNGKVYAISTRGLLPAIHQLGFHYDSFADEFEGLTRITDIFRTVRRHIQKAEAEGGNWRAVIDSLRPVTQKLWQDLPAAEKRYFLQHLSRYWNVARHRMPPKTAAALNEMRNNGKLEIIRGRLRNITVDHDGDFHVIYSNSGVEYELTAGAIVNCIGPESNFVRIDSELTANLLDSGIICCDDLSFGLNALPNGAVIGKNGDVSNLLFTFGTALKGILWESTAIPEIRGQAAELAQSLITGK